MDAGWCEEGEALLLQLLGAGREDGRPPLQGRGQGRDRTRQGKLRGRNKLSLQFVLPSICIVNYFSDFVHILK